MLSPCSKKVLGLIPGLTKVLFTVQFACFPLVHVWYSSFLLQFSSAVQTHVDLISWLVNGSVNGCPAMDWSPVQSEPRLVPVDG